jgi:hypothetical protein
MFESIFAFLNPILGFLVEKYGVVGEVLGYVVLIGLPIITILVEIADFIVIMTPSPKDDEFMAKVHAFLNRVMPVLQMLPHMQIGIPAKIAMVFGYIKRGFAALKGAVAGWKSDV